MAYIAKLDYHFAQARYYRLVIIVMDIETRQVVARYSTRIEEGKMAEAEQKLINRVNKKLGTNF
ncbi:MAG: hypothetical protein IJZ67_09260 [Alistipes sp.]|jgi:hypothetical protein|nr:hypothetical protein [Alistipes sp.]MBQ8854470.1 hypothetical protein [Alistipes sp.]